jgi:hypothetical protein
LHNAEPRYFILVGDIETWKTALKNNIWGFAERSKGHWNTTDIDDYLAFYATAPIKRVIGFGKVSKKFTDDSILFPDEKLFGKVMWLYRIEFSKICTIEDWNNGIAVPSRIMLNVGRKVIEKKTFLQLVKKGEQKWKQEILMK